MSIQDAAAEHLRVIRSLMERSSTYRAVSAPAALVGGLLALLVSFQMWRESQSGVEVDATRFLWLWHGVLVLAAIDNLALLFLSARKDGRPFVSSGFRMAMRCLAPSLLTGGLLGIAILINRRDLPLASLVWILSYGAALLATASFSPRSIRRLGAAFLLIGSLMVIDWASAPGWLGRSTQTAAASLYMGLTFGVLHIVYAVAVMIRRKPAGESDSSI